MAFPTTNLYSRYEAKLDTGYSNGQEADPINDQSGNSRNLSSPVTQDGPTYTTGVLNGEAVYRFSGSDQSLRHSLTEYAPGAWTLSLVVASDFEATSRKWVFGLQRGTGRILAFTEGATSSEWTTFWRTSAGTTEQATSGVDTTEWCVLTVVWDGSTVTFYRNGTQVDQDSRSGTSDIQSITIGGSIVTTGVDCFDGDIALAATWDAALDSSARAALHSYVQDTYGITVSDYTSGAITGTLSETEADDTLSASGTHTPPAFTGTLAETEEDDTLSASGTHTPPAFTGTLAETEADDTLAASGTHTAPQFTGSLAETEELDTLSASGTFTPQAITGTLAVTEEDDTLAATGTGGVEIDLTITVSPPRSVWSVAAPHEVWSVSSPRRT